MQMLPLPLALTAARLDLTPVCFKAQVYHELLVMVITNNQECVTQK